MSYSVYLNLFLLLQVGVVNLAPFRALFLTSYSKAHTAFTALPCLPPLQTFPVRKTKDVKVPLPVIGLKLTDLVQRLQVCYVSLD